MTTSGMFLNCCIVHLNEKMEFEHQQTNYELKIPCTKEENYSFPWRALTLSLMRISVAATCYWFGPIYNSVDMNGTIKGNILENKYKYYMYPSHIVKPVLNMTLYGNPTYDLMTVVSASGLLLGIFLDLWRRNTSLRHDGSGEVHMDITSLGVG